MSRLVEQAALRGKVAVVIGGASGIGEAISLALADEGVDVALCDIAAAAIEPARAAVAARGVKALAMTVDATDRAALARVLRGGKQVFSRLDIVVNVAGGTHHHAFDMGDAAKDDYDIRRNYGYVIDSVRAALPLMRRSGHGGSIINFTTIEAFRGAAGFAVYAGAKAAVTNFTRAMAVELGGEGIRVNCIAPDTTQSQGNMNAMDPGQLTRFAELAPDILDQALAMYVPLKQNPATSDLANGVVFLASGLAAFVSGGTLHIDGGTSAAMGFLNWPHGDGCMPIPLAGSAAKLFG